MTREQIKAARAGLAMAEAQLSLATTQLAMVRELLIEAPAPVRVSTAPACEGFDASVCAIVTDDARISRASFANRHAVRCRGCGAEGDLVTLAQAAEVRRAGATAPDTDSRPCRPSNDTAIGTGVGRLEVTA